MSQELVLVESLPINKKEIQIPSEELSTMQKAQYLKNIESTRDEIIRKIDTCKEYKKKEFLRIEKEKLLAKIENSEIGEIIKKVNAEIEKYNKIMMGSLKNCTENIEQLKERTEELASKSADISALSISLYKLEELKIIDAESFIHSHSLESHTDEEFEKKQGKLFDTKKKILQTHYKLMQDALLYYNVETFKRLLMGFFKLRDDINKVYVPIVKSDGVIDYE